MGRSEVRAVELSIGEKIDFHREVLGPYVRRMRGGRFIARILGLSEALDDPNTAARRYPVFELHAK